MKTIYFVRHGECQANADNCIAGSRNDSPLTKKGKQQADETAELLRGKHIDLIVSSPLSRAKVTAELIAAKLGYKGEIEIEPLLKERDFGEVSGKPRDPYLKAVDQGTVQGLETVDQFAERSKQAIERLKQLPGDHILVVGHGGFERMMRAMYEGRPASTFLDVPSLENGQVREYTL